MQTFNSFRRLLAIKHYSEPTIKTYVGLLQTFQAFLGNQQAIERLDFSDT